MANPYHYPAGHEKGGQFASKHEVQESFFPLIDKAIKEKDFDAYESLVSEYTTQFGSKPSEYKRDKESQIKNSPLYEEFLSSASARNQTIEKAAAFWIDEGYLERLEFGITAGAVKSVSASEYALVKEHIYALAGREFTPADAQILPPATPTEIPTKFPQNQFRRIHDLTSLRNQIEIMTSPENLYMDGEISRSQAQKRYTKIISDAKKRAEEIRNYSKHQDKGVK